MVEYYLTCPKKLNVVLNNQNGKNLKKKTCSKFFEPVQKITMCPKIFGQVQNVLDAFKIF